MDDTKKQPEEITDVPLPESELDKAVGGEAVTFNYGTIKWTYTQQKSDGTVGK